LGRGRAQGPAGPHDRPRGDHLSDLPRAGDRRAVVQPRGDHQEGQAGGAGIHRGAARRGPRRRGPHLDARRRVRVGSGSGGRARPDRGALVADLSGPGLGEQLRLVAWLRWRTLRNSLANKNRRLDLIGLAVSAAFSGLLVAAVAAGLFVGTAALLERHQEKYFGLIFLALLAW